MTEEKMLSRMKKGDARALEALISQYNAYVASIITFMIGSVAGKEDVEELVSDVFLSIWNHAETLKPGKVKPYIGASARNAAKSFLRKQKTLVMDQDEITALMDPESAGPENQAMRKEQRRLVRAAVLGMEQPDREIFLRYYYYLQTSAQIAEAMNLTPANVRSRLMRGRNALKLTLWKEDVL